MDLAGASESYGHISSLILNIDYFCFRLTWRRFSRSCVYTTWKPRTRTCGSSNLNTAITRIQNDLEYPWQLFRFHHHGAQLPRSPWVNVITLRSPWVNFVTSRSPWVSDWISRSPVICYYFMVTLRQYHNSKVILVKCHSLKVILILCYNFKITLGP